MSTFTKKLICRSIIGFVLGVVVAMIITAVSGALSLNDGKLHLIDPGFADTVGLVPGFIIQTILTGLIGVAGYGGAAMYRIERWSILRATLTHFLIEFPVFMAAAFVLRWISLTDISSILFMTGIHIAAYALIWVINFLKVKRQIKDVNSGLENMKKKS